MVARYIKNCISHLAGIAETDGINCEALVQSGETPLFENYDEHVPGDLLRKAYAADRLRADEAEERLRELLAEY